MVALVKTPSVVKEVIKILDKMKCPECGAELKLRKDGKPPRHKQKFNRSVSCLYPAKFYW